MCPECCSPVCGVRQSVGAASSSRSRQAAPNVGQSLESGALIVCSAACAVLSFDGCASGDAVSSAIDPVAQAAEVSELSPGFRATIYERIRGSGLSTPSLTFRQANRH
jgi:hypothetical protein